MTNVAAGCTIAGAVRHWNWAPSHTSHENGTRNFTEAAHQSQYMPEFAASLPLSATDGTLKRRFRSPQLQGRLRMKTGNLDDVSALAGYVNAASGRTYIAVILLNHPGVEYGPGEVVQAALIEWLFAQ